MMLKYVSSLKYVVWSDLGSTYNAVDNSWLSASPVAVPALNEIDQSEISEVIIHRLRLDYFRDI